LRISRVGAAADPTRGDGAIRPRVRSSADGRVPEDPGVCCIDRACGSIRARSRQAKQHCQSIRVHLPRAARGQADRFTVWRAGLCRHCGSDLLPCCASSCSSPLCWPFQQQHPRSTRRAVKSSKSRPRGAAGRSRAGALSILLIMRRAAVPSAISFLRRSRRARLPPSARMASIVNGLSRYLIPRSRPSIT
jgi:hypothetical protein